MPYYSLILRFLYFLLHVYDYALTYIMLLHTVVGYQRLCLLYALEY